MLKWVIKVYSCCLGCIENSSCYSSCSKGLREVDPIFHEELIDYGRSRSHMLNLAHFKDDSSPNGTLSLFILEILDA